MNRRMTGLCITIARLACAAPPLQAQADKAVTIVDANVASEAELAKLPHMTVTIAKALVGRRPFATMTALDMVLEGQGLTRVQRTELYGRLFVPVNLNTASDADILLIPGVGNRLLREFKEYRPYKAMEQFRREIGKYVSKEEVARLERYVTIN
jgi:DNA uptake protein ComE-like DNA-binding protein